MEENLPMIKLDTGMCFSATCNQPPGAAQRSMRTRAFSSKRCSRFSWSNLNAARDRKPIFTEEKMKIFLKRLFHQPDSLAK